MIDVLSYHRPTLHQLHHGNRHLWLLDICKQVHNIIARQNSPEFNELNLLIKWWINRKMKASLLRPLLSQVLQRFRGLMTVKILVITYKELPKWSTCDLQATLVPFSPQNISFLFHLFLQWIFTKQGNGFSRNWIKSASGQEIKVSYILFHRHRNLNIAILI